MNIISLLFMLFLTAGLAVYYIVPDRVRWICLLVLSLICLWAADWRNLLFIGYVSLVAWGAGLRLDKLVKPPAPKKKRESMTDPDLPVKGRRLPREKRKEDSDAAAKAGRLGKTEAAARAGRAKHTAIAAVILLLLVLALSKYLPAALGWDLNQVNRALAARWRFVRLIVPFGLSYYLLMAISYVLDVYWQRQEADRDLLHVVLFLAYFPQLTQGPIGRFGQMQSRFLGDKGRAWDNLKRGLPLMLWGLFKKMVIADRTAVFVGRATAGRQYGLNVWICLILYGIDLYCDFSGGIDLIRGISECFGIELTENFRQPYFSRDLGEFWRRWHVSLGTFMKDYVFFPLALWKPLKVLKKRLRRHMSVKMASKWVVAIGDLIVFLVVGIWHGAGSKYAGWGLYNGIILAFSALMEDSYRKWKTVLGIRSSSRKWQSFRLIRTLVIVTIGWTFDCADTALGAVTLFFRGFLFGRTDLARIFNDPKETWFYLPILAVACLLLLWVDLQHEKGVSLRAAYAKQPYWKQVAVWTFLFQAILLVGRTIGAGGFMYANF